MVSQPSPEVNRPKQAMKPKAGKEYKGDYKDAAAVYGIQDPAVFDEVKP